MATKTFRPMGFSSIGKVLQEQVKIRPHASALAFPEQGFYYTYAEWLEEAVRVATALVGLGVKFGDRVAIIAQNRIEWPVVEMATFLCGAIFVPLNTHFRKEEMQYVLQHSGARVLFCSNTFRSHRYLENVLQIQETLPDLEVLINFDDHVPQILHFGSLNGNDLALPQVNADDSAGLLYTSGTTGFPKGVLLTHQAMLHVPQQCMIRLNLGHDDRWTSIIPLFHCAGCIMNLLGTLVCGGCYVGVSAFDPELMFRVIQDEKCTVLSGVPTSYLAMLDHDNRKKYDLSSLRTGTCGGAMVDPELLERCAAEYPIPELTNVYGLTETSTVASLPYCHDKERFHTSGQALDESELRVTDIRNGRQLEAGEIGQVEVRGPMVMQCYYKNEEETTRTLDADGWLKTGDMGFLRSDGYLCLSAGRLKEMIIRGGENIYPMEVEKILMQHDIVEQVAVFGIKDEYYGEIPAAAVISRESLDFEVLENYARSRLAAFKVPVSWYQVDALPMTASGKIRKLELRERAEGGEL